MIIVIIINKNCIIIFIYLTLQMFLLYIILKRRFILSGVRALAVKLQIILLFRTEHAKINFVWINLKLY